MTTLYVNRYSARCGFCHATVPDWQQAEQCDAVIGIYQNQQNPCGGRFTHSATESNLDRQTIEMIVNTRTDLIWKGIHRESKD